MPIETMRGVPNKVAAALKALGYHFWSSIDPRTNTAHRFVRGTTTVDLVTEAREDQINVLIADPPSKVRRNAPNPVPAVLMRRLTIDAKAQDSGLGRFLVRDAMLSTLAAAGYDPDVEHDLHGSELATMTAVVAT